MLKIQFAPLKYVSSRQRVEIIEAENKGKEESFLSRQNGVIDEELGKLYKARIQLRGLCAVLERKQSSQSG
jgi:hypothetical protein